MYAPTAEPGTVQTPPASAYQDQARFAAERAAIFGRSWLVAGLASSVCEPGSYTTVDLAGMPVVICRDRDGALYAMANVCQHRGMLIATGSGRARTLNCPNHAWVYALDGQLRGAPRTTREADFDCASITLPRFAVHQWGPFLLVNLDASAAPPLEHLATVEQDLAGAGLTLETMRPFGEVVEWTIEANWKIVVENYLECYHCAWVHQDLARVIDVSAEKYVLNPRGRLLSATSPVRITGETDRQQSLLSTDGPMTGSHWHLLYPSASINLYPGRGALELTWYLPETPGRTRAFTALLVAPDAGTDYADQVLALLTRVGEEDNTICESMHRGMVSGAIARERVLPENEALITHFHRLLADDLAGASGPR
jgi:choline monooxygenase